MESLKQEELDLLLSTDFLRIKANALAKVNQLLSETRDELKIFIDKTDFTFPANTNLLSGKISIGENYRGLPYQVLDYPSLFNQDDIFAFRTMFWWGNFFSLTFQLQGKSCENYRELFIRALPDLLEHELYLCVNDSPWEHHFDPENYKKLEKGDEKYLSTHPFIKLSKKVSIDNYKELPQVSVNFFTLIILLLK